MKRTYKEMGKCDGCRYLDWVDKKWWGCTTKVCTFRSKMGKALPQHKPIWCPLEGERMTNYERIKAMTLDEMAEFLCHGDFDCDKCAYKDNEEGCKKEVGNYKGWLEREVGQSESNRADKVEYEIDSFGIAGRRKNESERKA